MPPRNRLAYGLTIVAIFALGFGVSWCIPTRRADAAELRQEYLRVTFYTLRGQMANGEQVHPGAAACSKWIPFGTELVFPDGYVATCTDRGHGDWYWDGWVDLWVSNRAIGLAEVERVYGLYTWVDVKCWGPCEE